MRELNLDTLQLKKGLHSPIPDMSFMEAVAFQAGEEWSDNPQCASPVISAFMRDYCNVVDDDVLQTMKPYIHRLINTRSGEHVERRRALAAADWLVRIHAPFWFRLAGLNIEAESLSSLPELTSLDHLPTMTAALSAACRATKATTGDVDWLDDWKAAGNGAAWNAATAVEDENHASVSAMVALAWGTAWKAAWRATGYDAHGWHLLEPTVREIQATIPALIDKMLAIS